MRAPSLRLRLAVVIGIIGAVANGVGGRAVFAWQESSANAKPGSLSVTSEPAGAAVYVDGQLVGQTPVTLPQVVPGDHRVRLVKDGFLENGRVVKTNTRRPTTLEVRLTAQPARSAGLRIVVIEGEDAVNIIQQRTAVAPVVEVRDRNDQPVAGAVVRFAIRNGRASFSGARSLTVTTNAAGRAVATGLTPTGSGTLQIGASAAFQGQTAVATIVQTNVLTAAEAAGAAGAGGAGGGAGAGAGGATGGGAGGGLSATTLGILGGAVAGGAIAATKTLGAGGTVTYSGPYAGQIIDINSTPSQPVCAWTVNHMGNVHMELQVASDGTVTGTGGVEGTMTVIALSPGCGAFFPQQPQQMHGCCTPDPPVRGTTGSITFSGGHPGGAGTFWTYDFTGALSGTTITGTFTLTTRSTGGVADSVRRFPVTLSKN